MSDCEEGGEGALTAQQRVADDEMQPIFSPESELLFKDKVLEVSLEREGATMKKKCCLHPANT